MLAEKKKVRNNSKTVMIDFNFIKFSEKGSPLYSFLETALIKECQYIC